MFNSPPKNRIKGLSFNSLVPNILTVLALCSGLTSMRFGLQGKWEFAVEFILLAGFLDGLDGRIARLLQGTSKFGAELDSLSDFISFGVAPAILLYLWTMVNLAGFGWALTLLYVTCMAMRLARFNIMIGEPNLPSWAYNFFTGMPAPAAAGIVMMPMIASFLFETDSFFSNFFKNPMINATMIIFISFMMVSKIPTWSGKKFRIPTHFVLPAFLLIALMMACLVTAPWGTLTVIGIVYLASIPLSAHAFLKLKREANRNRLANEVDQHSHTPLDNGSEKPL